MRAYVLPSERSMRSLLKTLLSVMLLITGCIPVENPRPDGGDAGVTPDAGDLTDAGESIDTGGVRGVMPTP